MSNSGYKSHAKAKALFNKRLVDLRKRNERTYTEDDGDRSTPSPPPPPSLQLSQAQERRAEAKLASLRRSRLRDFKEMMQKKFFSDTLHGHCYVCDRIWWDSMLRTLKPESVEWKYVREIGYDSNVDGFTVCTTCLKDLKLRRTPHLATINGFVYPEAANLPELCPIGERLVAPRVPFMTIRHVRFFEGSKKLYGQAINVPVDVQRIVSVLPRNLDDDMTINVCFKRNLLNKSSYLAGCVSKSVIKEWLRFLVETQLYRAHNITIDPSYRDTVPGVPDAITSLSPYKIFHTVRKLGTPLVLRHPPTLAGQVAEGTGEYALGRMQETMFWGEDHVLEMAPGQHNQPLALAFDADAEELSFPTIYYGQRRLYTVRVTPFQMSSSEIRRTDRRGVKSNHILYMAAKIMRLNMISSYNVMFRNRRVEDITRKQLEDPEYVTEKVERDDAFMHSLPNSVQYWQRRKNDLFALMRQLGKPTVFLTLSASEVYWLPLLKCCYRHKYNVPDGQDISDVTFDEMNMTQRAALVNEDPVLCCLYFDRLVDCILSMLKLKKGPFGKYHVLEYFKRVEFQHRGSPHCHILLWLDNAPPKSEIEFENGEDVPAAIELINELCCVDADLVESERRLQTHRHTHTCYKRNTKTCRFGAPFWPMKSTRVLLPLPVENRVEVYAQRYKELREKLVASVTDDMIVYDTIEEFWAEGLVDEEEDYLNILRHGLRRPTVMYKRSMKNIMISPFNCTISTVLQSNMDIQYILDEYSCAAYVAEYVNKTDRGTSSLHRELVTLRDQFPDMDYESCLKEIGKRVLNNVEMCTQEAAWYLLRLPMSEASRIVVYIPTQHPSERPRAKKSYAQMNNENLSGDSTDVWKTNMVYHYQMRPRDMDDVTLADFAAWYAPIKKKTPVDPTHDTNGREAESNNEDEDEVPDAEQRYRKRTKCRVIRWRNYITSNELNYKRMMATLFWPFRSEELDLLNDDKYLNLYAAHESLLMKRRSAFQTGLNIDQLLAEVRSAREMNEALDPRACGDGAEGANVRDEDFIPNGPADSSAQHRDRDIDEIQRETIVRAVKSAMSHENFCKLVRTLNYEQRALLLEFMTRIIYGGEPLQIFFCGPAGSGKTYLLRALMETINRFSARRNLSKCAYLACATTGKAAVNIDGTTVHSGLNIPIGSKDKKAGLAPGKLNTMRCDMAEVCTIIIDEVSMMSSDMLRVVEHRLSQCGKACSDRFGGFNVVFCGDLRQLPPVCALPVYTRPNNMTQDSMIWQNLQYYPLVQVMRQTDKQFSDILTKIGDGLRLHTSERRLIESRFFVSEAIESCPELCDAVRVFHRNEQVDTYNFERIYKKCDVIEVHAEDTILGAANDQQKQSALNKLYTQKTSATGYLPRVLYLGLDSPYTVSQNIDHSDRLVNGSVGKLKFIESVREGDGINRVTRLWLLFEDELCGAKLRMKYAQHMIEHRIDRRLTPILKRELTVSVGSRVIRARRRQFPVNLSLSQTIHKVQGASFDQVVYDYDKSHNIALVYVALSRARSIEGLFLTNSKHDHNFYHCKKDEQCQKLFRDEIERLKTKTLVTFTDRCNEFIHAAKNQQEVTIATLNVQSAVAHSEDVSSDYILNQCSALILTETWMHGNGGIACRDPRNGCDPDTCRFIDRNVDEDEELSEHTEVVLYDEQDINTVSIEGYKCVTRSRKDRGKRGGGGVAIYESLKSSFTACHRVELKNVKNLHGDVCCAFLKYRDKFGVEQSICLVAVYCHPGVSAANLVDLCDEMMWRFCRATTMGFHANRSGDLYWCPLVMCGDFNFDFAGDSGPTVLDYFRNTYGLDYKGRGHGPTSRNGTTIDAVFERKAPLELMYYTLYFSTHRGMIISLKEQQSRSPMSTHNENTDRSENKCSAGALYQAADRKRRRRTARRLSIESSDAEKI